MGRLLRTDSCVPDCNPCGLPGSHYEHALLLIEHARGKMSVDEVTVLNQMATIHTINGHYDKVNATLE